MDKKAKCGSCGREDYVEGVDGSWVFEGEFMGYERWLCPACADDAVEHGGLHICPCGCNNGKDSKCVYEGAYQHPFFNQVRSAPPLASPARCTDKKQ